MNTRNRPGRNIRPQPAANTPPYGLGTLAGVLQARPSTLAYAPQSSSLNTGVTPNPACSTDAGRPCRHPLTNEVENKRLLAHEPANTE